MAAADALANSMAHGLEVVARAQYLSIRRHLEMSSVGFGEARGKVAIG